LKYTNPKYPCNKCYVFLQCTALKLYKSANEKLKVESDVLGHREHVRYVQGDT